jgi:hypothetical protein
MGDYTKPKFEIEWNKLNRGFIGKEPHSYLTRPPVYIDKNTYAKDFFINDSYKTIKLGTSILIEDMKEHIKPQYYQLSKLLGITHIGSVSSEASYTFSVIKPDSIISKILNSSLYSRTFMYPERYIYYLDSRQKFNIDEYDIPKFIKENVFDKIYELANSQEHQNINFGNYYIVFCSEEHGIYGNIIDPKTLYPLDMGFIMSNVMNSAVISTQFASLQSTISRLEDKIHNLEKSRPKKKLPLSTRKFSYFGTTNKKKTRKNRALSDRDIVYV